MRLLVTLVLFGVYLAGCASGPPFHYYEDESGRFYKTTDGKRLRVDANGSIAMVSDGEDLLRPPRVIGRTAKMGEGESSDWDLSKYQIVEPTGTCEREFPWSIGKVKEPGVSCWNRLWEVPAMVVTALSAAIVGGFKYRLGLYRNLEMRSLEKDVKTCQMQTCSEEEKLILKIRLERLLHQRVARGYIDANRVENLGFGQSPPSGVIPNPGGSTLLGPMTPNAYGPGINSDATGRPFMWQPQFGGSGLPDPTLRVNPNAFGPGIGMDQYGRPVRPGCPPGMMC